MEKHQVAHQLKAMEKSHFDQWVLLFNETINELYTGENAEKLKDRAKNIAVIMQMKILGIDKEEFEGK
jgi:hemoglobin